MVSSVQVIEMEWVENDSRLGGGAEFSLEHLHMLLDDSTTEKWHSDTTPCNCLRSWLEKMDDACRVKLIQPEVSMNNIISGEGLNMFQELD